MGEFYDSLFNKGRDEQLKEAAASTEGPDQAATILDLQARTGLPPEMIRGNLDYVKKEASRRDFDAAAFRKENPVLAEWLAENPEHFSLARDDIENLSLFEKTTRRAKLYSRKGAAGVASISPGMYGVAEGLLANTVAPLGQKLAEWGVFPTNPAAPLMRYIRAQREYAMQVVEDIAGPMTVNVGRTERAALSGVQSAGMNLVALGAGIVARRPEVALSLMSTTAGGLKYNEAIERGFTPDVAALAMVGEGAVEAATEMMPVGRLFKDLADNAPFRQIILRQMAVEIPQEQAATAIQDLLDWSLLQPDATLAEYAAERPGAAYDTLVATIVGTGIQTGAVSAARSGLDMLSEQGRARAAERNKAVIEALGTSTEASKVRERLPAKHREFVERVRERGDVTDIRVPVEAFNEYFQSQNMNPEEVANKGGFADEYNDAVATADDVTIPLQKYTESLAATEHHAGLIPSIRFHENDMTLAEAEAWNKNRDQLKAELIRDLPEDDPGAPEVYETARQWLIEAGKDVFSAEQEATVIEAMFVNVARMEGRDPTELFNERLGGIARTPLSTVDTRTFEQVIEMQGPQLERIRKQRTALNEKIARIETDQIQINEMVNRYELLGVNTRDDAELERAIERDMFKGQLKRDQQFGINETGAFPIIPGSTKQGPKDFVRQFRELEESLEKGKEEMRKLLQEQEALNRQVDVIFSGVPLSERAFDQLAINRTVDFFSKSEQEYQKVFNQDEIDMTGDDLRGFAETVLRNDPNAVNTLAGTRGGAALRGAPTSLTLEGLGVREFGIHEPARAAARRYMEQAGLPYREQIDYAVLDEARATRIAQEFDLMEHNPEDPEVRAAYAAMIEETLAQYQVILDTGLEVEFIDGPDPYGIPHNAILDVVNNNHLWVYSTRDGFGSDATFDASQNPLLQETEYEISGQKALANDIFTVVHDYFGHIKNGVGFRARGEENAWQSHAAMYSPLARRAMTVETRGQSSWVNYGPHGEFNRTASGADTIYADQKIGLLPMWVSEEGRLSDTRPKTRTAAEGSGTVDSPLTAPPLRADGRIEVTRFSKTAGIARIDPEFEGTGADSTPAAIRRAGQRPQRRIKRSYFGISPGVPGGYRRETLVGRIEYKTSIDPAQIYDIAEDPLNLRENAETFEDWEVEIQKAGYTGWWQNHPALGLVAVAFEPLQVESERKEFNQDAARNSLGLYSAVEQAVWDMKLPEWKQPDGRASGKAIWQKLKSMPGVKNEELFWLGIEEWLSMVDSTTNKPIKRSRAEVAEFIRNNGVVVEEVEATMQPAGDMNDIEWQKEIITDASFWEHWIEDYKYEFDRTDFIGATSTDVGWFWDHEQWIINNWDELMEELGIRDNRIPGQIDFLTGGEGDLGQVENDFETILLLAKDYEDQLGIDAEGIVREAMRKDFLEAASAAAESAYMENPVVRYYTHEMDVTIEGNDDYGYTIIDSRGDAHGGGIYSFSEAEIQAVARERELGNFADKDDPQAVKWASHVEGSYENYRELKYTAPGLPGDTFTYETNFPDENIITFQRVTDRILESGQSAAGRIEVRTPANTNSGKYEVYITSPSGNVSAQAFDTAAKAQQFATAQQQEKMMSRAKSFHIDEYQSDWHQQGRQFGYSLPDEVQDELRTERRQIMREHAERPGMTSEETRRIMTQMSSPIATAMPEHPAYLAQAYIDANVPKSAVDRIREIDRLLSDDVVPDAPFRGDNWIIMGMKRALVKAVEEGYDAFSWANAETVVDRYSEEYRTFFTSLYDKKMVGIVQYLLAKKKLTGIEPKQFDWNGTQLEKQRIEIKQLTEMEVNNTNPAELVANVRGDFLPGKFYYEVHSEDGDGYASSMTASGGRFDTEAEARKAAEKFIQRRDGAGYWIIPITDELRERIKTEGFSMWQNGETPRGRVSFDAENKAVVQLLRNADPTTVMHEMGHVWLEMVGDLVEAPGASQRLTQIYADTLNWLGVENRSAITTEHHEKLARALEAYLREGKAPSPGLQRAFAAFKAWFMRIYQKVAMLDVQLNDDIRSVFDRLLASDEQIEAAKQMRGHVQLFATAEEAGMSARQFAAYQDEMNKAHAEADAKLTTELMSFLNRESKRAYKEQRKVVREQVAERVQGMRGYRALSILTLGKEPDGTESELAGLKLDKDDLIRRRDKEFLKQLPRPYVYTLEGGTDADIVAMELGYGSAGELLDDLVRLKSAPINETIETETDLKMAELYPDPLLDGSAAEIALHVVHSDKYGDILRAELRALEKKRKAVRRVQAAEAADRREARNRAEDRLPGREDLPIIKAAAREFIGSKQVREVNPNQYLVAEKKHSRLAFEAMKRQDYEAAYDHKLMEIRNHHLYRAADAAKKDAAKIRKYLTRFHRKPTQERLGKAGAGLLDQILAILDTIDLRNISGAQIDREAARRELAGAFADGLVLADPEVIKLVTGPERGQNWQTLTVAELAGVRDVVKQLEALARREAIAIVNGERIKIDEAATEIADAVRATNKEVPEHISESTGWESWAVSAKELEAAVTGPSVLARLLDGSDFGPINRLMNVVMRKAYSERLIPMEKRAIEDVTKIYSDHYDNAGLKGLGKRRPYAGLNNGDDMSKADILSIALNMGNEGNRAALFGGVNSRGEPVYPEDAVMAALSTLDSRDWAFVQAVWDYLDTYWPLIEAAERRRRGIAPKRVEAVPFSIRASDGQTVRLKGGYYPLSYNARFSQRVKAREAIEDVTKRMDVGMYVSGNTRAGATHERVKNHGLVVKLGLYGIDFHLREVIRDLSLGEEAQFIARVLNSNTVYQAFADTGNLPALKALKSWLKDAAIGELPAQGALDKFAAHVQVGFTMSRLMFNTNVTLLQLTGIFQSMATIGSQWIGRGAVQLMSNPNQNHKLIFEKSAHMRARYSENAWNKDVQDVRPLLRTTKGVLPTKWRKFLNLFKYWGFYPIRSMQLIVDDVTWLGAYQKAKASKGLSDSDAVSFADAQVELAQTSGFYSDRSGIERGSVGVVRQIRFIRLWTTLISYMLRKFNLAHLKSKEFRRAPSFSGAMLFASDMLMLFTLEAIATAALYGRLPDDDDDEEKSLAAWVAKESALSVISGVPIVREIQAARYGGGTTPLGGVMADIFKASEQIGQAIEAEGTEGIDRALLKSINNVGGTLLHYPSGQLNRLIDAGWADHVEGEEVELYEYVTGRRGK